MYAFANTYNLSVDQALTRLVKVGMPATREHLLPTYVPSTLPPVFAHHLTTVCFLREQLRWLLIRKACLLIKLAT